MDITGKLIKILPEVKGTSQRGEWVKGGFVIETEGQYPRQAAFVMFGAEKLALLNTLQLNSMVVASFSPESREFNDRWYTDLRCYNVQPYVPGQMPAAAMGYTQPAVQPAAQPFAQPMAAPQPAPQMPAEGDDLPF